jgi:hypothetical protein
MSDPIKLPSARQPVTETDPQTQVTMFSRPWFLFFQLVYQRIGGSFGVPNEDLGIAPFNTPQGVSFAQSGDDLAQAPAPADLRLWADIAQALELRPVVGSLQEQVAELTKKINDLQQGTFIT